MDLAHAVKTGRFRANLYYRLNVLPVAIPALHERREDIRRLAEHFITRFHDGYGKKTLGDNEIDVPSRSSFGAPHGPAKQST